MSLDIDMQDYMGAMAPAATEQNTTNSFQNEVQAEEYPVNSEVVDQLSGNSGQQNQQSGDSGEFKQERNFEALRLEIDRMKAERDLEKREHNLQLEILKANSHRSEPQQEARKDFEGLTDSDLPTVGEIRKEWDARERAYRARLEELEVASKHSDYAEVLDKYLKPLINENPLLAHGIGSHPTPAAYAYELGKLYQQAKGTQQASAPSATAQRIVENARKPGTLSQGGGQGTLSKAEYYATMSDQEFHRIASRNLGEI
jgi:hypothetical protein